VLGIFLTWVSCMTPSGLSTRPGGCSGGPPGPPGGAPVQSSTVTT
jgi:hypothetical protein